MQISKTLMRLKINAKISLDLLRKFKKNHCQNIKKKCKNLTNKLQECKKNKLQESKKKNC